MLDKHAKGSLEVSPLKVGDTVYVCTAYNDVVAIDAATGRQRWRFNAHIPQKGYGRCRGVAYYKAPGATPGTGSLEQREPGPYAFRGQDSDRSRFTEENADFIVNRY